MRSNLKDGQLYYAPYRRRWGVWVNHASIGGTAFGEFVRDYDTKEEARQYVFRMNGWEQKEKNNDVCKPR